MLFLVAFALGFLGYLPLGTINLTVVQMTIEQKKRHWQAFILFAAAMEFIYCFACFSGINVLLQQKQLAWYLNWVAAGIFFLLGVFSFYYSSDKTSKNSIKRGMLVAVLNPLQIPFWTVWGVYVLEHGWVKNSTASIVLFSGVCSLGTVAVLYMYAVAGKKIVQKLNVNQQIINRTIGLFFIALAIYQAGKQFSYS